MARGSLLAFLLGFGTGCYSFPAVAGPPAPGSNLVLELNDQGRAALGQQIGISAARIEGQLQSNPDSAYPLRVTSVEYLNGQSNRWSGEPLSIQKNLVSIVKERQFSRSRSFLLAAGVLGAAAAFMLTRGILGHGSPETDPPGGKPDPQS
ncbi:MAG: hypothetical protein ABI681_07845 [Gemmatimonadales bacterium]